MKNAPFDPWRNLLVSAAGPFAGGLAALGVWIAGEASDSRFLIALAYTGFLLNLFNLIPVRPLGRRLHVAVGEGAPARPPRARGRGRRRARRGGAIIYGGLIATLALGMVAAHIPQDRL